MEEMLFRIATKFASAARAGTLQISEIKRIGTQATKKIGKTQGSKKPSRIKMLIASLQVGLELFIC
jgi:hypothetical protein